MPFLPEVYRVFQGLFFPVALVHVVLHLFLAIGVYREASDRVVRGRKLWFFGAGLWAVSTGVGGMFVAATYWVMHHSTLCAVETADGEEDGESLAEKLPANPHRGN